MRQIQCVIIDNNSESNTEAKLICERIPFIKLLKSFDNLFDAIEYLRNTQVDLLICSIELNEMNGADFIANLKPCPEIIFISDNEQAACRAFELGAVDYLLRPINFPRMLSAANKVWRLLSGPTAAQEMDFASESQLTKHLFIKTENKIVRVSYENILLIEGYGDYIKIHTNNQGIILSTLGIKLLESKLPQTNFIRVHRSYIVAIDKIDEIENKRIRIGQVRVPISETFAKKLNKRLGL